MTIAKPTPPADVVPGTAPIRGTPTFYQDAQVWADHEGAVLVPGVNAHTAYMNDAADFVEQEANTAEAAAATAVAAAAAAVVTAGATVWAAGDYNAGDEAISPTDWLTYRAKTTGNKPTDPATDPVNWVCLNATSPASAIYLANNFGGF